MSRNIFRNGSKWPKRVALGAGFLAAVAGGSYAYNQLKQDEAQEPTKTVRVSPDVPKRNSDGQLDNALFSDDLTEIVRSPEIPYASVHAKTQDLVNQNASPEEPSAQTQDESSFLGLGPAPKTQETLDCALEGDWTWTPELANCETITMETSLAKGQKSLFERGVPQEVVTRNFKEMQDYLVNTGQLDEVIDNIYVENKDGERVWKKAGEDCGDGFNDVWDGTVFTFEFTPDIGSYMKNPTNTPQTAYDCESCDEPEPTPEMAAVPDPEPESIPEPEVEPAQPTREPITLRQANISCLEDHLEHNNQTNLEGINGVIGNEWVINVPVEQAFGYIDPTSADETTIVYLDLKDNFTGEKGADGIVDSKMTIPNPYTSSERAAFTSIYNGNATEPIPRDQLETKQENFKNAIERISSKDDYCVFVEANNEPVEPVVQEEPEVVVHEEPRVVYEEVRPTTEVRRAHRHDNYCNHNVGHAPVRRGGFFFNASYSKTKIRGYGPTPHFRGGPGFRGGFQGYNRRPVRPFLDVRGSIRHGGPSSSDMLNHRLNQYKYGR